MQKKKILVTGGAGFIGSHLCRRLLLKGHEVICMDNLFTTDRSNIYDLLGNPKFSFVLHDITQPFMIQVDEIYNLACPNLPRYKAKNPVETMKTSVIGSINMLELASKIKAKILQASTSKVYGYNLKFAPSEDYWGIVDPIGPNSSYSEGKRAAETLFMDYYREYGVDIKIARIFTTYGPNMPMDEGKLFSNFIMNALTNRNITIWGDGSRKRSLMYIDDLIDALLLLMETKDFHGPINLAGSFEFTIQQLTDIIIKFAHSKSKVQFQKNDLSNRLFDEEDISGIEGKINLAQDVLGRKPKVSLEDGLKKTINFFKAQKLV